MSIDFDLSLFRLVKSFAAVEISKNVGVFGPDDVIREPLGERAFSDDRELGRGGQRRPHERAKDEGHRHTRVEWVDSVESLLQHQPGSESHTPDVSSQHRLAQWANLSGTSCQINPEITAVVSGERHVDGVSDL